MIFRQFASVLFLVVATSLVDSGLAKSTKNRKGTKKSKSIKAKTIHLSPGDSIQDAIDEASENTVIRLCPGDYIEEGNLDYGLRITKNNIKLIGTTNTGGDKITRILRSGEQIIGVYAAPEGCDYKDTTCDSANLSGFSIEGIVVEGFPDNGIQTRWVDSFEFLNCKSVNNRKVGLYATLSSNGTIKGCVSTGALNSGLWVSGVLQVKVLDNDISDSITGLTVSNSKDVYVANNNILNNVVGISLLHVNLAGCSSSACICSRPNFPFENWVIEKNRVFDNNRENTLPAGFLTSELPSGIGILMIGVRGHTIRNNIVEDHDATGILMVGFCTLLKSVFKEDCADPGNAPRDDDPSANDNTVIENKFSQNGKIGLPALKLPGSDILYLQSEKELLKSNDNCFEDNTSPEGEPASFLAIDGVSPLPSLPTGGCI